MADNPIPPKESKQWIKNEKIINENPVLKRARDRSEGFTKSSTIFSSGGNSQQYKDNWERIFGGDRKNVNHREETDADTKPE
jgi:hypothetical protein